MMKTYFAIALCFGLAACSPETPDNPSSKAASEMPSAWTDVSYEMRPFLRDGQLTFLVDFRFPGDTDGITEISIPSAWQQEKRLSEQFGHFTARGDSAETVDLWFGPDASRFNIEHAPGENIHLSYEFKQRYPGTPIWNAGGIPGVHPLLQPGGAVFFGEAAFPFPRYDGDVSINSVAVTTPRNPEDWSALSSKGDLDNGLTLADEQDLKTTLFAIGLTSVSQRPNGLQEISFDGDPRFGLAYQVPDDSGVDFVVDVMVPPLQGDEMAYGLKVDNGLLMISSEMASAEQRQRAFDSALSPAKEP